MRFSRNWIGSYTDLPTSDTDLSEALSSLGLVVDAADARGNDLSLDLDVASNRPDVMNHVGVARELALLRGTELRVPQGEVTGPGRDTGEVFSLSIDDETTCPRFVACALFDVEVTESPGWLVERLESIGLRPINAVVDVTNFVMWELGRPMHAYDLDRLEEHRLVVRHAHPEETLVTLDEIERKLSVEDLVIADGKHAVGLAGVMGGRHTGVTETTRRVLLECATFDPPTVRAMARRHGMHTDASHRFERGLSHSGIMAATRRAAGLIVEICGGAASANVVEVAAPLPAPVRLEIPVARVAGLLGAEIPPERVEQILTGLTFQAERREDAYHVTVPATRLDVTRDVDVLEEIARFHGYERLPDTLPLLRRSRREGADRPLRRESRARELCAALGYWQAMTLVFSSEGEQAPWLDGDRLVALSNPLNEAMSRLRARLAPALLAVVARNINVGAERVCLFEIGRVFREPSTDGAPPVERRHLAIVGAGLADPRHHLVPDRTYGFDDLKAAFESLSSRMRWPQPEWSPTEAAGFQPGSTASVRCGSASGTAGRVDAAVATAAGLERATWLLEIDIDDLLQQPSPAVRARQPARFPAADRDVTLLVPTDLAYADLAAAVTSAGANHLESLELIGIYRGDDVPDGAVAMTLRLTFRSRERTLTAEEIESGLDAILARLAADSGAVRR